MIKTLSPYYVSVELINPLTGVVCDSYTVKIYVWAGSKNAAPSTPEYEITKINAAMSNGTDKINIARIVNDFIEFTLTKETTTTIQDGNNQVWVKYAIYYNDIPDIPSVQEVVLATKGYCFFLEGENPQLPANKVLITEDEYKVNRGGFFVVPLLAAEPSVAARSLVLDSVTFDSGSTYDFAFTANFTFPSIYILARNVGDTEFIPLPVVGSLVTPTGSFDIPVSITEPFEVKAVAFDSITSQTIISNTVTVS